MTNCKQLFNGVGKLINGGKTVLTDEGFMKKKVEAKKKLQSKSAHIRELNAFSITRAIFSLCKWC